MKQVEVTILGQSYLLACPEGGEARLAMAVSMVDREMSAIRDAGKIKARERMAVLAALNIAYLQADRGLFQAGSPLGDPGMDPPPGGRSANPSATPPSSDSPDLNALMQRLDEALADDGRLL